MTWGDKVGWTMAELPSPAGMRDFTITLLLFLFFSQPVKESWKYILLEVVTTHRKYFLVHMKSNMSLHDWCNILLHFLLSLLIKMVKMIYFMFTFLSQLEIKVSVSTRLTKWSSCCCQTQFTETWRLHGAIRWLVGNKLLKLDCWRAQCDSVPQQVLSLLCRWTNPMIPHPRKFNNERVLVNNIKQGL